jgi:exodeoxyribonuclease-1
VLEQNNAWANIQLDQDIVTKNKTVLLSNPTFAENIRSLYEGREEFKKLPDPEEQLYDSFVPDVDRIRIEAVRNAGPNELADFHPNFNDERLDPLLLHYKGRNFPKSLSADESVQYEQWRASRIESQLPSFSKSLQYIASKNPDDNRQFLLQELQLWAESIMPADL